MAAACPACQSTDIEDVDYMSVCMDCGQQVGESCFVDPTESAAEQSTHSSWVPQNSDGSNLLDAGKGGHELRKHQLPEYHAQCAQLCYHSKELSLPPEVEVEGLLVLKQGWIDGVNKNNVKSDAKIAAALYVSARLAKVPLMLTQAVLQLQADRAATIRHFIRLRNSMPNNLPRFQHEALAEQALTRYGMKRKLKSDQVNKLICLAHRLLEFCRRNVTEDLVANHTAAVAMVVCECLLQKHCGENLFADLGIPVAYRHTYRFFYRRIVDALNEVSLLLPSSAMYSSPVERCPQILDIDECLNG